MQFDPKTLWLIAGVTLVLLEFASPGVILVFFGLGAIITSLTTWAGLTTDLGPQVLVFGASSLALLFSLRRYVKKWFVSNSSDLNGDLDDDFTGREALALTPFTAPDHDGRVEIKGAEWKARARVDIPAHATVIIDHRQGLTLHVRPRP